MFALTDVEVGQRVRSPRRGGLLANQGILKSLGDQASSGHACSAEKGEPVFVCRLLGGVGGRVLGVVVDARGVGGAVDPGIHQSLQGHRVPQIVIVAAQVDAVPEVFGI